MGAAWRSTGSPSALIQNRAMSTARKESPLKRKARAMPKWAMTRPATPGPTTRAALKAAALSEMALDRSPLPTIST